MQHGLDVVAPGIEHEAGVVARVVVARAGCAVVGAAVECGIVERLHVIGGLGTPRVVARRGHGVLLGCRDPDGVAGLVVDELRAAWVFHALVVSSGREDALVVGGHGRGIGGADDEMVEHGSPFVGPCCHCAVKCTYRADWFRRA